MKLWQNSEAGGGSMQGDDNLNLFINGMSIFVHTGVWDYNAINQAKNLNWGMTTLSPTHQIK